MAWVLTRVLDQPAMLGAFAVVAGILPGCGGSSSSQGAADGSIVDRDTGAALDGASREASSSLDAASSDGGNGLDGGAGDSSSGLDGSTPFCPVQCDASMSFCEVSYGPPNLDGGSMPSYFCEPFQSPCEAGVGSCACATVGPFCTCVDDAGAVTVTCPFHP